MQKCHKLSDTSITHHHYHWRQPNIQTTKQPTEPHGTLGQNPCQCVECYHYNRQIFVYMLEQYPVRMQRAWNLNGKRQLACLCVYCLPLSIICMYLCLQQLSTFVTQFTCEILIQLGAFVPLGCWLPGLISENEQRQPAETCACDCKIPFPVAT